MKKVHFNTPGNSRPFVIMKTAAWGAWLGGCGASNHIWRLRHAAKSPYFGSLT